jgi:hypothetical protein
MNAEKQSFQREDFVQKIVLSAVVRVLLAYIRVSSIYFPTRRPRIIFTIFLSPSAVSVVP